MRAFWSDPYLWIHLAGLATVPILLELCLLGLAVGDPLLPGGVEVLLVAAIGIAPILWMQWQRPFCIFSLTPLALKPSQINEQQRRMLHLFKSPENRILAIATAILLFLVLLWLYRTAPLVQTVAPFSLEARWAGLLLAAIAFLGCNLFVQVSVSVVRVLLISDATLNALEPYPTDQITQDFTLLGFQVDQILPPLIIEQPSQQELQAKTTSPEVSDQQATPAAVPEAPAAALENSPWDEEEFESSAAASSGTALDGLPEVAAAAEEATAVGAESIATTEDIWGETPSAAGLTVTEGLAEQAAPQSQASGPEEAGEFAPSRMPSSEVAEVVTTAEASQIAADQKQEPEDRGIAGPDLGEISNDAMPASEFEEALNSSEVPLPSEVSLPDEAALHQAALYEAFVNQAHPPVHTTDQVDQSGHRSVVETPMIEADQSEIGSSLVPPADAAAVGTCEQDLEESHLEEASAAAEEGHPQAEVTPVIGEDASEADEDASEAIAPIASLTDVEAAPPVQPPLVEIEAADFDAYVANQDIAAPESCPTDEAEP